MEMTLVEHMRKRMGMYLPTDRARRPKPWVWENLLYALAADGVESFLRGEATHLAIDGDGKRIAVAHDGRLGTGGLERVFELQDGNPVLAGVHWCWFGNIRYALVSALAERLVIEASEGGEWRAVESRCGVAGPVQRLLPGLVGEEKGVRIAFVPDRAFLPEGVEAIEAWEPEELRRFGAALACGHPGLRVSVNGREFFMPEGAGGLVERQMEEDGGEVSSFRLSIPPPFGGGRGRLHHCLSTVGREQRLRLYLGTDSAAWQDPLAHHHRRTVAQAYRRDHHRLRRGETAL